jgi:rubrerythrin
VEDHGRKAVPGLRARDESELTAFEDRLKADVRIALMRALSDFSDRDASYKTLAGPNEELSREILPGLAPRWEALGIRAETFRLTQAEPSRRDQEMIARLKKQAEFRDPAVLAAALLRAQQEALKTAKAWKCPYCDSFNLDAEICPHCGAKKPE